MCVSVLFLKHYSDHRAKRGDLHKTRLAWGQAGTPLPTKQFLKDCSMGNATKVSFLGVSVESKKE